VSESGISSRNDVKKMKEAAVNAVLVGEALVTARQYPRQNEGTDNMTRIKICGIRAAIPWQSL
jgi:tryptophan synthase alpha subunit